VLVLQVFRRAQIWWLLLAIGVHALLNLAAVGLPEALGLEGLAELLLPEAIIAVAGLVSVWVVWRLRDEPREEPRADA